MRTECPHCQQQYNVDKDYLDQIVECTACGQEFVVEIIPDEAIPPEEVAQTQPTSGPVDIDYREPVVTFEQSKASGGLKALTCEMCGSTDLIKQNGVFVCQSCGIKYSLEDARQMMISGTVSVAGTVSIDNSNFVKKSLENARRALKKTDWEEAEKYYNRVEENDPQNIEAVFYSSYLVWSIFYKIVLCNESNHYKILRTNKIFPNILAKKFG